MLLESDSAFGRTKMKKMSKLKSIGYRFVAFQPAPVRTTMIIIGRDPHSCLCKHLYWVLKNVFGLNIELNLAVIQPVWTVGELKEVLAGQAVIG